MVLKRFQHYRCFLCLGPNAICHQPANHSQLIPADSAWDLDSRFSLQRTVSPQESGPRPFRGNSFLPAPITGRSSDLHVAEPTTREFHPEASWHSVAYLTSLHQSSFPGQPYEKSCLDRIWPRTITVMNYSGRLTGHCDAPHSGLGDACSICPGAGLTRTINGRILRADAHRTMLYCRCVLSQFSPQQTNTGRCICLLLTRPPQDPFVLASGSLFH